MLTNCSKFQNVTFKMTLVVSEMGLLLYSFSDIFAFIYQVKRPDDYLIK